MLYQIIIGVTCLYVTWKVWFRKKTVIEPPQLSGKLPFIGNAHRFLCDAKQMYKLMNDIAQECLDKDGVIKIDLGFRKIYAITDPEDCLTVANSCLNKDDFYNFAKPVFGDGLILSNLPKWKIHRRLLNPAFNTAILNSFLATFNSQARLLNDMFAKNIGTPIDHESLLRINNLETICLTAAGLGGEEYNTLHKQYVHQIKEFMNLMSERLKRFWLQIDFFYNLSSYKTEVQKHSQTLVQLSNAMVQAKKAEIKHAKNKPGKVKPFMELMLTNETGSFTDQDVREEMDSIIVAGYETSASALTFVFTILGSKPEVQEKVYQEILEVIGNSDRDVDKDDVSKLVYTEAVLKETMRVFQVGPTIGRVADKPVKLRNYTIEANSGLYLFILGLNRHPIWGPDANEFRPERWFDAATLPDSNYFGVFGLGRRACIGKSYALMLMKTVVAHVLRRFRIKSDVSKLVMKWEILTRPESGHEITLEPR